MPSNYGDVALNLPPDWDRSTIHNKEFTMTTVGHHNGVSDAYLTKDPEARHQFFWLEKGDRRTLQPRLVEGYKFVTKDEWTINLELWEWNAEGLCQNGLEVMMARAEAKYHEARQALVDSRKTAAERQREEEEGLASRTGIVATDEAGERIVRRRRR